jgi:hypothetical protein
MAAGPGSRPTENENGGKPALTRSKLPADSGKRRTDSAGGGLNDPHYVGRMALPPPLTQKNEDMSATVTLQEETRLSDLPD